MMTMIDGTLLSSAAPSPRRRRRRPEIRLVISAVLLALAGLIMLAVGLVSATIPFTVLAPTVLAGVACAALGWIVAVPRI